MIVKSHRPAPLAIRFPQRDISVGNEVGADGGLVCGLLLQGIIAPLGRHHSKNTAAHANAKRALLSFIIWALHHLYLLQRNFVRPNDGAAAGLHR